MPNPTLNRRYQKLIDQLDKVPNSTREMFLYLFSMVAVGQGIINVVRIQEEKGRRIIVMNDPVKNQEFRVLYPDGLEPEYADAAIAEMERLLGDDSLGTRMDATLFNKLYERFSCRHCSYNNEQFWQFCAECHFAGHPINFEKP
ncbi:MAG: hypothetical protein ACOX87_04790 [Chloroflexota bacterium]|jgi:hypothetical protein